jgi:hypothetical protein
MVWHSVVELNTNPIQSGFSVQLKASVTVSIVLKHANGHQVCMPTSTSASWLAELLRCLD